MILDPGAAISAHLGSVARERTLRAQDPDLARQVDRIKRYQQDRFRQTYADLLSSARYGQAARFFLEELYGPSDFTRRDAEFARIVPALVRMFPDEVVRTVESLGALHALSEGFDTAMGRALGPHGEEALQPDEYARAWQLVGDEPGRTRQISLVRRVGESIDRLTRVPMLRTSLKLMRGPARASGLGTLQAFLESGFDHFHAMRGAGEFLSTIEDRESALSESLFGARTEPSVR
jgi:hypothetical protein